LILNRNLLKALAMESLSTVPEKQGRGVRKKRFFKKQGQLPKKNRVDPVFYPPIHRQI